MDHATLAHLWALLLALMLTMYVLLDGFDLGIGVLSLFTRNARHRGMMMSSIHAVWDANETWLVLAGGTLFGAFPLVYGTLLNALYIPIMLMLFGLVFRAVSFEFRGHSGNKRFWELAFGLGSLIAVVGQGFALGGVLSEVRVGADGGFAGGPWDWLNPLSVLIMVTVVFGFVMIGAAYLIAKAPDEMQRQVHRLVVVFSILMFIAIAAISVLMPFYFEVVSRKWVVRPERFFLYAMALGAVLAFAMLLASTIFTRFRRLPFVASLIVFVVAFASGLALAYPYLVPPSITIAGGASGPATLTFMLWGIGPLIPVMLLYNFYLYRVFRGVTESHEGYE